MKAGVILLAGGRSSRMGRNKALLPVEGKSTIERIIDRLSPVFHSILLVTNEPSTYAWLSLPMIPDEYPGLGPMAGIHAGLKHAVHPVNLVVACDMPFVSAELGRLLVETCEQYDSVVPSINQRMHPLFAAYHQTALVALERSLKAQKLRMMEWLTQINTKYIDLQTTSLKNPEEALYNMNDPEEYNQVQYGYKD